MPTVKFSSLNSGDSFWVSGNEYKKTEPTKRSNAINVVTNGKARFGAIAQVDTSPLTRRQTRYGKLVRGWDWRTTPELLERAEQAREKLGVTRTEFLERAITELIGKA